MTGPMNGVVGDQDMPTALPQTQVPAEVLVEEKKLAQYSQTAEFKRLREFMENRVKFYQRYLPNGSLVEGDPVRIGVPQGISGSELSVYWTAACIVIKEFENVLGEYDRAKEAVEDHARSEGN